MKGGFVSTNFYIGTGSDSSLRHAGFYDSRRPHSALERNTSDEFHFTHLPASKKAA